MHNLRSQLAGQLKLGASGAGFTFDGDLAAAGRQHGLLLLANGLQQRLNDTLLGLCHLWNAED